MKAVSLVDALLPRAVLVAEAYAQRIDLAEAQFEGWRGFARDEGLIGTLESPTSVRFLRPRDNPIYNHNIQIPLLRFYNITMLSLAEKSRETTVIESNVVEHKEYVFELDKPVKMVKRLSHTFKATIGREHAEKKAWEAGGKASLEVGYGGVKGAVEAFGKYGEDIADRASSAEEHSDTEEEEVTIQGPIDLDWEAYRCMNRERSVVTAAADFDHGIAFDGPASGMMAWSSFKADFLPLVKGLAPETVLGYHAFMERRLPWSAIVELDAPLAGIVEFIAESEDVLTQKIRVL